MKIFVTGASGLLGGEIVRQAITNGHDVVAVDIVPLPINIRLSTGSQFLQSSFENSQEMARVMKGCDAMVHTAGLHGQMVGIAGLDDFLESNIMATSRLLEAASAEGIQRVVLSSTMEIVIGCDWKANGLCIVDESTKPCCDTPYAISRLLLEQLSQQMASKWNMSICCLRYMAFDERRDDEIGIDLLARYISVRDAANAVMAAFQCPIRMNGEVFHVGPETPLTNLDIAHASVDFHSVLERHYPGAAQLLESRGDRISANRFWPVTKIEKIERFLGWRPKVTFEAWLKSLGWKQHASDFKVSQISRYPIAV